jgi:hypothetical protein
MKQFILFVSTQYFMQTEVDTISSTSGGRSVGMVRLRTKGHGVILSYIIIGTSEV